MPLRGSVDRVLLLSVTMLVVLGIGMVFSASFVMADNYFGDSTYFLTRHLVAVMLGLCAMLVTMRVDYHRWQRLATPIYLVSLVLLALVLVPGIGTSTYGASRWFTFSSTLSVQPSELAKIAMVIYLASWVTRVGGDINKLSFGTIPFIIIVGLSAGLVFVEPDLGTALVLLLTAGSVFFIAGANLLHGLMVAGVGCFLLVNFVITSGYKADRILAFLNPWADPAGIGWHTVQTLLALGSGGVGGLGLGASRQKWDYLPNPHTDSIYAIVGEEIGFVGAMLVLFLFLVVAWRGLAIASAAPDPMGRALAAGGTLYIVWQALLNMAVTAQLVPYTGVPLPFLSYGGTAMLVSLASIGIVMNVSRAAEARSWRSLFFPGYQVGRPAPKSARPPKRSRDTAQRLRQRRTLTAARQ